MTPTPIKNKQEMRNKILDIVTYHSDEGTSGYLLSDKQIDQLLALFDTEGEQVEKKDEVRWEKEFDEGFKKRMWHPNNISLRKVVKDYIRNLLSSREKRIRQDCEMEKAAIRVAEKSIYKQNLVLVKERIRRELKSKVDSLIRTRMMKFANTELKKRKNAFDEMLELNRDVLTVITK